MPRGSGARPAADGSDVLTGFGYGTALRFVRASWLRSGYLESAGCTVSCQEEEGAGGVGSVFDGGVATDKKGVLSAAGEVGASVEGQRRGPVLRIEFGLGGVQWVKLHRGVDCADGTVMGGDTSIPGALVRREGEGKLGRKISQGEVTPGEVCERVKVCWFCYSEQGQRVALCTCVMQAAKIDCGTGGDDGAFDREVVVAVAKDA